MRKNAYLKRTLVGFLRPTVDVKPDSPRITVFLLDWNDEVFLGIPGHLNKAFAPARDIDYLKISLFLKLVKIANF